MRNKVVLSFVTFFIIVISNFFVGFTIAFPETNAKELSFCGSGATTEQSETINYSRKEMEEYNIKSGIPCYYSPASGTGCANIAGAVVIGYYDRFCENLIPNCKTYTALGSVVRYRDLGTELNILISELKELMETDKNTVGTTFNGYQKGMRSYVNSHGYTYSTEDLGKLNFDKYKAAVHSNKPVAIFLSNYSIQKSNQSSGNSDLIKSDYNSIAHVVVGYGYKIDTYYNSNNAVIATRTYIKIASGLEGYGLSHLCLDGKSKIDNAISTKIE